MSWFESQPISDVQTAIQTSTIQTAVEANTSKLSDTAFTSFLQNAPIPRFYNTSGFTSAHPNASSVYMTFAEPCTYDPYKSFNATTGVWTAPIDGFYSHMFSMIFQGSASGFAQYLLMLNSTTALSTVMVNPNNPGGVFYQEQVGAVFPCSAGDTVRLLFNNQSAGNLSNLVPLWGAVWCAPYKQYSTGSGGN